MSRTLPPHAVLTRLEESRRDRLQRDLSLLARERERLAAELRLTQQQHREIERQRRMPGGRTAPAAELATLDTARREVVARKADIAQRLAAIEARQGEIRRDIAACMGKCKAYALLRDEERRLRRKQAGRAEQRAMDEMAAARSGHRP